MSRSTYWPLSFNILSLSVIAIGACLMFSQEANKLEGSKPYTPTRLEWLAVEMNANARIAGVMEYSHFDMTFVPIANEDAILIYAVYLPTADRGAVKTSVDAAKSVMATLIKSHGWNWVKVKERIEPAS